MSRNAKIGLGLCAALTLAACCCGLAVMGLGGLLYFRASRTTGFAPTVLAPPTAAGPATPVPAARRTPTPTPAAGPTAGAPTLSPDAAPAQMAERLAAATMAPRDLRLLAQALQGGAAIPVTVADQPADHAVGTVLEFSASNDDDTQNPRFTVSARLVYKTENVYFFAERGVAVDEAEVQTLVDDFQNQTYPTNRAFFGSEWSPGVDGDPRLYILYARGLGFGILGYYYPVDEYARQAYPYSNEKEIFYINADLTGPGDRDLASTLAHEFQHMIHWNEDRNEEIWVNEGASMLAEQLNGYAPRSYAADFTVQPDLQLNAWTEDDTIPHYGAAYMFLSYFLDRFGEAATQALIAHPANGLTAVDLTLAEGGFTDPASGRPLTADDVVADWVIANYANDPELGDGRYVYTGLSNPPTAAAADTFFTCPLREQAATVAQYGTDYYQIDCAGTYTLKFAGAPSVPVVPSDPYSGQWGWWSNRGDESVATLTRAFDFAGLSTVTLNYAAWWDIEEYYDYLYLLVSTDAGATWDILQAPSMTDANPHGANFGWGYTGQSAGWQTEQVDLSAYAGQNVLVRFQYITDAGLNKNGLVLDDVAVPELNTRSDFEADGGGWEAEGFVRLENTLPQKFAVQVLRQAGGQTTLEALPLGADNRGQITLTLNRGERAVLAVTALTRYTTEAAEYRFSIEQP